MLFEYATNASCPQRPSWQITEVGYAWAQIVFHSRKPARKAKHKRVRVRSSTDRGKIILSET